MKLLFKPLKIYLAGFYYSFPVQLVLLHVRKYQLLLLFWWIVGSAVAGHFMSSFGADSLFLAPEYLGSVSFVSALLVGMGLAIFIMSWNITTFILFSSHFKFLATTSHPFLKYCLNNAVIPLFFLVFYFIEVYSFERYKELMTVPEILWMFFGFLLGLTLLLMVAFGYFFGADQTILRSMAPVLKSPGRFRKQYRAWKQRANGNGGHREIMHVDWYFSRSFRLRKPRDVNHYSETFLDTVFKRHHFATVLSILLAFLFLMGIGFCMDNRYFQIPAAASILIFFSLLLAAAAAFVYWMGSWSMPMALLILFALNGLFEYNLLDMRNKLYGLNYSEEVRAPEYSRDSILALCTPQKVAADEAHMLGVLEKWWANQEERRPLMYIINVSGGGTRSATFTMSVLQTLDSLTHGQLMRQTFLMTGASGGMLGATYFRELYRRKQKGALINLQDPVYTGKISGDLLNPLFSSFVARDLMAPAQQFSVGPYRYIKDRGYAFEQQLSVNTDHFLDGSLKDYVAEESSGTLPLVIYNGTISRDGRRMMMGTQPMSFLMLPISDSSHGIVADPDGVDFGAFFHAQDPMNIRVLSALRVNATFPYVLPNVWLPSVPVIDLMDAGLRDNFGQQTTLRFLQVFDKWISTHTRGVVFIQIRDRKSGDWEDEFKSQNFTQFFTRPFMTLQNNWPKMQDYGQEELVSFASDGLRTPFRKLTFTYVPAAINNSAPLNFHLTAREKQSIILSLQGAEVGRVLENVGHLLNK